MGPLTFHRIALATLLSSLWFAPLLRAAQPPDEVLDEVVVIGEQPGPPMWKLSKDGHTMWIMGTLAPVPAKMTWRSKQAEAVIARSGEILGNTSARADVKVGFFGKLSLVPSLLRLRNNPDGATLQQALPPDVYARFSTMYRRYYGKDPDPKETSRPLFAANEIYSRSLEKSGLAEANPVWPVVTKLAKQHKVRIRQRDIEVPIEDPKGLIAEVAKIPRDKEVACLVATLDYIDRELPNIKRRATAWAVGDVPALRALPAAADRTDCLNALLEQPKLAAKVAPLKNDIEADRAGIFSWMLLTYETSFTAMPVEYLLHDEELITRWRAAGYTVEEPR
ncbi:MAG: TraB/GumN family protein [Pseudomonadota bacterium]